MKVMKVDPENQELAQTDCCEIDPWNSQSKMKHLLETSAEVNAKFNLIFWTWESKYSSSVQDPLNSTLVLPIWTIKSLQCIMKSTTTIYSMTSYCSIN